MKFIHAADIHLDSPLRGLLRYEGAPVDEIRRATRRAFDNLIDLAIDEAVDFVVLAGDLYDGDWKDYNTGLYFVARMNRLGETGIPVFMISGNHDAASQITRHLRLPDNVTMFDTASPQRVVREDLGVAVHGQSFASRAVTADLSANYPQGDPQLFNIGLLHTGLDGKPGHEPYAPATVDGLRAKGYQYWALGHVHTREIISRDPWIVFPGNIQGRHARETGPKGCTLVTVENREVATVTHRDLDILRWLRYDVDVADSQTLDDVYERVRRTLQSAHDEAEGRVLALRLTLAGASALHAHLHAEYERWVYEYRALASGLSHGELWLEKIALNTRPLAAAEGELSPDDPLHDLLRGIREKEIDDGRLEALAAEVADLGKQLRALVRADEEYGDPTSPEQVAQVLPDVRELLVNRLLAGHSDGN